MTSLNLPVGYELAYDSAGRLLQSRFGVGTVVRYTLPSTTGTLIASGLPGVGGLAFDAAGALYVTSTGLGKIVRVPAFGPTGDYVTGLHSPRGLAFDSAGVLYVSNRDAGTIQRIGADTTAPVVSVPASVVVEAGAATGAAATFAASVLDDAGPALRPGIFPKCQTPAIEPVSFPSLLFSGRVSVTVSERVRSVRGCGQVGRALSAFSASRWFCAPAIHLRSPLPGFLAAISPLG